MIKRIHFFWLNLNSPVGMSIGVSTLSHLLEQKGFEVKISHLCEHLGYPFEDGRIREDIEDFGADMFAVSFSSTQFEYMKKLVGLIRKHGDGNHLICGGIHSITAPETVISIPGVDGVCLCEADEVLPMLVERINRRDDWRTTPGFWFKTQDGIKKNQVCPPPDISLSTATNFNLINYRTMLKHKSGFAEIMLGRGCLFRCSFCQNCVLLDKYKSFPKHIREKAPYL
ncbi:cobalamin-dependent protein, partial [bacterium]